MESKKKLPHICVVAAHEAGHTPQREFFLRERRLLGLFTDIGQDAAVHIQDVAVYKV